MTGETIIRARGLNKRFGPFLAVDDVSFDVEKGEIFGLLGPNGAGKTTTIRIFTGIIKPSDGTAEISGYDIQKHPIKTKQMMSTVPEMSNAYVDMTAIQNLLLMGDLYGIDKKKSREKAEKLLKLFGLYEKRDNLVKSFSKGMKQRLIVAMALMNDSKILFLDEPTSGLDIESSRLIKRLIRKFNNEGVTIFLTTHNMDEADQLCDRIAVINNGKIIALERPEELKRIVESSMSIEVAFEKPVDICKIKFKGVSQVEKQGDRVKMYTETPEDIIPKLVNYSKSKKNKIMSLNTFMPTLEDVFVTLTKDEDE